MPVVVWVLSFAASFAVAGLARRLRALNRTGFLAAGLVGGIITAAGGWQWGVILLTFFASSSLLSKIADRLEPDHDANIARGSERDLFQVIANGGVAAICALLIVVDDNTRWFVAFAASLAVANADTWATELGSLSRRRPRLITSGRTVPPGTSGAISALGTIGSILGAILIAVVAALLAPEEIDRTTTLVLAVAVAGLAGSVIDSFLGATIQLQLYCPVCGEITETQMHHCGTPTVYLRGAEALTNDAVNIIAVLRRRHHRLADLGPLDRCSYPTGDCLNAVTKRWATCRPLRRRLGVLSITISPI
jgi:uncharacterized protein (TIGR00297 family)